jgi:tryptophanyl-tRNA synthetase
LRSAPARVFSGIQPTGDFHLGNLLGAVDNWVPLQDSHEAFYCIVDLHALTLPWDPEVLHRQVLQMGALLLARGIDPDRSVLFVQSHVPQHTELAWILTCVARMGELRRMVQFKEKARGEEAETIGAGLFVYPVLQAADVLLYRAGGVPVGEDQRQHIELMRDLAVRFNSAFGDVFVPPEAWIRPAGARILALDDPGEKMSKSTTRLASKLLLVDDPAVIAKKVRAAVTDSGREVRAGPDKPALTNLLTIFSLATGTPISELEERFSGSGYGDFKKALAEAVIDDLRPTQERYRDLMADPGELGRLLAVGAAKATAVAEDTMAEVRARVGLGGLPGPAG